MAKEAKTDSVKKNTVKVLLFDEKVVLLQPQIIRRRKR